MLLIDFKCVPYFYVSNHLSSHTRNVPRNKGVVQIFKNDVRMGNAAKLHNGAAEINKGLTFEYDKLFQPALLTFISSLFFRQSQK